MVAKEAISPLSAAACTRFVLLFAFLKKTAVDFILRMERQSNGSHRLKLDIYVLLAILATSYKFQCVNAGCAPMLNGDKDSVAISDDPLFVDKGWIMCEEEAPVHERCTLKAPMVTIGYRVIFRASAKQILYGMVQTSCAKFCPDIISEGK